jgi:DNA (cytosine-5)-methyltransferase 1
LETTSNDYSRADGFTMIAQPTAGTLGNRGLRSHTELDGHGAYIPVAQPVPYDLFQITAPVNRQNRQPGDPCHTLARDNAAHAAVAFANRTRDGVKVPEVMADGVSPALTNPGNGGRSDAINVAIGLTTYETPKFAHEVQPTLTVPSPSGGGQPLAVAHAMTVRRLSPRECERLMGFPDSWTEIPWRGKPAEDCPDGPRYKALGNSMACNCMAWIGERIAAVHSRHEQRAAP